MQRTPLTPEHVGLIREIATERRFAAGDYLVRDGDRSDEFFFCLEGEIEAVDPLTKMPAFDATIGPGQFLGELSFLNGGTWGMCMRAKQDSRCIVAPREKMLALMASVPEISDIIVTVYAARRRRVIDEGKGSLVLIGAEKHAGMRSIASFAARNKIPFREYELGSADATQVLKAANADENQPALVVGSGGVIHDPTPRDLAQATGLDMPMCEDENFDVVIVGAGPAGIAAAVYAGAEGLKALVIEDRVIGGQAGTSSRIENYMGFPTGISGSDLCFRGEIQAMRLGTRFVMPRRVVGIEKDGNGYCITLDDGDRVKGRAIIVATGVQYRRLPIPRLSDFEGEGIYYSATDSEARFCVGSDAVIIGGGNSAGQAAMFLSRYAKHVHVLVRGQSLATSMSAYLTNRLQKDPRITIHYQTECTGLDGPGQLEAIEVRYKHDGTVRRIDTCAMFVMVGAVPKTEWLSGIADLDDKGFVLTGAAVGADTPFATSAPGIYAVGDVRAASIKRVASSVGEGSVVVSHVWQYVNDQARSA